MSVADYTNSQSFTLYPLVDSVTGRVTVAYQRLTATTNLLPLAHKSEVAEAVSSVVDVSNRVSYLEGLTISVDGVTNPITDSPSFISAGIRAPGATNIAEYAVSQHTNRTDNPHAVTASQIGALTNETDAIALAFAATNRVTTWPDPSDPLAFWTDDTTNRVKYVRTVTGTNFMVTLSADFEEPGTHTRPAC